MKRLGTTPRRRPTVACSPTIGHRTPKAPVSQDISFIVPIVDEMPNSYFLDHTNWNKWVPERAVESASFGAVLQVPKTPARVLMEVALQEVGFKDIRVVFNVTEQHYIITAKRPTPHAPPP